MIKNKDSKNARKQVYHHLAGVENYVKELTGYLKVLLNIGFLNSQNPPTVSFEVKPLADESSEVVIANAKRVLKSAWLGV